MIPIKGRGFMNQGSGLVYPDFEKLPNSGG